MLKRIGALLARQLKLLSLLLGGGVLLGALWSGLGDEAAETPLRNAATPPTPAGAEWGQAAMQALQRHVLEGLPISVANACGLGASSCFKCHNGQRAPEPGSDPATAPWHVQHQKVNGSCVACHQGNPRLMKKNIAHNKLVPNPISKPQESCFSCHAGADGEGKLADYRKLLATPAE